MKITSRIFAVVLVVLQILVLIPATGVVYGEEQAKAEILFKYTGDDADDSYWKLQKGNYELTAIEGRKGNVLKLGKSESYFAVNKEAPISKGNVVLSYDLMSQSDSGYAYIILAQNSVQSVLPIPWTTSGRFGALVYNGSYFGIPDHRPNSTVPRTFEATVKPEVWQHVDLWLNFDARTISLYVDGRMIATEQMHPEYLNFYSFGFVSDKEANLFYMDNMNVAYVPTGAEYDFDFIQGTPPEVATLCYVETKYEPLGHIYTDKKIKLTAEIENIKDEPHEITYKYRAATDDGHLAYTEENTVKLEPKEKKSFDIEFNVDEYGFYDSIFTITDNKSGKSAERVSRFSVIKIRTDGKKSRITGNNSHYQANRGTVEVDRIQKLFADMGIAEMREGAPWAQYESTIGTYELTERHRAFLNAFKENNQNVHFILGHENLARNIPFPKTESELAAWAAYIEHMMQDLLPYGIRDFEVWNEVDLSYGAGTVTAEEYVNLLKVTYPIVHKYVPDARVFAFSCARNYSNFIGECLAIEGCRDYFDGISYHPYDVSTRPEVDNFHPVENSYHEYIEEINDIVEKYNLQDKVLVISEFGYTSSDRYMTEDDMANWVVRASCLAYDEVEYINWFMNVEKIDNRATSDAEYHFGWLRAWERAEILFEAKPVIPAVAQYNSMITESAESLGNQEILNGKGRLYRYKDDGRDVYMAWTIQGEEDFAIDLGAPQAVIYDRFGNSYTQNTENGILYIRLSERLQYITGNFTKYEEVKAGGFRIEGDAVEAAKGDILGIKLYKNIGSDSDYSVDVVLPEGTELADNKGFVNGICNIGVIINKEFVNGSTAKITVKDKEGSIVWFREVPMNIIDSAKADFSIKYNKSGRWTGELKITNMSNKNISGNLNILNPVEISEKLPSVKIDTIIPKMTRLVTFNLPVDATKDYIEFRGEAVFDNGDTLEIEESSYFTGMTHIPEVPKIDGVVEKNEYNTSLPIVLDKERMVQGLAGVRETFPWEGLKDLSGKGYINYDEKYFYLAMEVEDDIMGSNDEKKRIWANDSIQFSFAERREKDSGYTEIGIGVVDGEPAIARYYYMGEKENIVFHDAIGVKDGFEEDMELEISRNGTKTTYELKLPWVDIYPTREPFNMENVFFSIIINENDLNGREGWLEFSPGIGYVKNPANFTSVIVIE